MGFPATLAPQRAFGLGMRRPHYAAFMTGSVPVDFVEVISENFMVDGGRPLQVLDQVRGHYDVALHSVSMSLGSAAGLDHRYLERLRRLADRVEPLWVSDHLCWTGTGGTNTHDLLPLPRTPEALDIVCRNITVAQDWLDRPLLIENPSTYVDFVEDTLPEWAFLAEVVRRTGCYLLLDVNNVFVSAHNHEFSAHAWLDGIPWDSVRQIHLAGHSHGQHGLLIDTHDSAVSDPVWALYARAIAEAPEVAVMIERDDAIPPLAELLAELDVARRLAHQDAVP